MDKRHWPALVLLQIVCEGTCRSCSTCSRAEAFFQHVIVFALHIFYDFMYLHSAELNAVAVTENVNTFLLVWAHVSRYGVNWLYFYEVYKVLTVVMYSSQLSNYQLHRLGNTFPIFSLWVFGFLYRAAHVNSKPELLYVVIFIYYSLVMMLNFVFYLDGIKHSGSLVRAAHPFTSLSREYK